MQIKINKLPASSVEIEGGIDWADFEKNRPEAVKNLGANFEMPGFRKGHIPENILLKNIPDIKILEEMTELALPKIYLKIIEEHKIDAIGRPEISITKLAPGNPLEFKIKTAVLPEVKLPDYKTIAKENKNKDIKVEVTEEEMEKTIGQLRKMRSEHKDHNHDVKEEELPVLDDEFVKTLGNFKDVEDFKAKLKDNIRMEKEGKEHEKGRIKMIEAILAKTEIDLPRILVESELDKMLHQIKGDIEMSGLSFEDYLKHINKTEEDMRQEWDKEAAKRAKLELILHEIANQEQIKADDKNIETETEKLMKVYKDADKERARAYIENVLTNEKIWEFLENQ
jgi:FKBP-type peptidyl-prolyl cis-trans isomerase (trigger factor)